MMVHSFILVKKIKPMSTTFAKQTTFVTSIFTRVELALRGY